MLVGSIVTMLIIQVKKLGSHQVQAKLVVGGADSVIKQVNLTPPKPTAPEDDASGGRNAFPLGHHLQIYRVLQ